MRKLSNIQKFIVTFATAIFVSNFFSLSVVQASTSLENSQKSKNKDVLVDSLVKNGNYDANNILVMYKGSDSVELLPLVEVEYGKAANSKLAQSTAEKEKVKSELKKSLANSEVVYAQPNYIYDLAWTSNATQAKPADYDTSKNWYFEKSKLPELWKDQNCPAGGTCGGSNSVVIAVIDSGLAFENYDDTLASGGLTNGNFLASPEYDAINMYTNPGEIAANNLDDDCNGAIDDVNGLDSYAYTLLGSNTCTGNTPIVKPTNFTKVGHPVDTYGHGSFVTGIISSEIENGDDGSSIGGVGAAFNIKIMPIAANVHFNTGFTSASLISAVKYAKNEGANIINFSVGGTTFDSALNNEVQSAFAAGVVIIAASGNAGTTQAIYPANYENVLSVGAANADNNRSYYSSYGSNLDVVAYVGSGPASAGSAAYQNTLTCTLSSCSAATVDDGFSYVYKVGTSFAAPQAAALAGYIKSKNNALDVTNVYDIIKHNATDINTPGFDQGTGYGVINFQKTYKNTPPQGARPVYRFWSNLHSAHFYTIFSQEKEQVIKNFPTSVWYYEGIVFSAFTAPTPGTSAVYRFWSDTYGSHFYTSQQWEKDNVINNYPDEVWKYETVAYYVYLTPQPATTAVHRFWSPYHLAHFYTAQETEKTYVQTNFPASVWTYEWVEYYVYPGQS